MKLMRTLVGIPFGFNESRGDERGGGKDNHSTRCVPDSATKGEVERGESNWNPNA